MKTLIPVILAMLLCGCVRIGVEKPVGTPASQEELKGFEGEWFGADNDVGTISISDPPMQVTLAEKGDLPADAEHYSVTSVEGVLIAWEKPNDLDAFLPGRIISGNDDSVVVLIPDEEEVKRLVESHAIEGRYDEAKDAWILSPKGLEKHLKGKQFWALDKALVLIRKRPPVAEANVAPAPEASTAPEAAPTGTPQPE